MLQRNPCNDASLCNVRKRNRVLFRGKRRRRNISGIDLASLASPLSPSPLSPPLPLSLLTSSPSFLFHKHTGFRRGFSRRQQQRQQQHQQHEQNAPPRPRPLPGRDRQRKALWPARRPARRARRRGRGSRRGLVPGDGGRRGRPPDRALQRGHARADGGGGAARSKGSSRSRSRSRSNTRSSNQTNNPNGDDGSSKFSSFVSVPFASKPEEKLSRLALLSGMTSAEAVAIASYWRSLRNRKFRSSRRSGPRWCAGSSAI